MKGISQYNALRSATLMIPRILVVLFLPAQEDLWIEQTPEHLMLRKCAYWRSLNGAPETINNAGVTIQLPHQNIFTVHSLKILMERIACNDPLHYDEI
ncbi:DUF4365 domain-containing protein [Orrella sp. 11846]|uniref:DUF4365 domain-containing protein n=1 Tax=Orrella sp. 11846 TaxID=3409913 RepID=UPI003B5AB8CF